MSMLSASHDPELCHEANQTRLQLIRQLRCLTGQLNECDRRALNPFPRREKPDTKYAPSEKAPDCPTTFVCCPAKVADHNRPSAGAVSPITCCQENRSCRPECVPCNASFKDLCAGYPQWFTDCVDGIENTVKPELKVCGQCENDLILEHCRRR